MNTQTTNWNGRCGAALLSVLGVISISSMILASVGVFSLQRSFTARKLADRVRAQAYAEAGVNEAYAIIAADWSQRTNTAAFPLTAYGDGTFEVTVTEVTNTLAVLHAVGICNGTSVDVMVDIGNFGNLGTPGFELDESVFDYAILCGGDFDFSGCGNISSLTGGESLIHANGLLNVKGSAGADVGLRSATKITLSNNITVDGDVTAPVLDYRSNKVTITGTAAAEPVPLVTIPDIDLTPFFNWADAHGEVRNGFSMSGGSYTPNGGVLWVNGNVQISSDAVFNGSIVATGNIKLAGSADITPTTSAFSVASRDGDISNQSSGTITGLIYARMGDYDHTANGSVEGQIIVKGDIKKAGNSDALLYSQNIPTPPDGSGGTEADDQIGVSAWQR